MLPTDYLCLAGLLATASFIQFPPRKHPQAVLWVALSVALAGALGSFWLHRWQIVPALMVVLVLLVLLLAGRFVKFALPWFQGRGVWGFVVAFFVITSLLPLVAMPIFSLPQPAGPYSVGSIDFTVTDRDREELYTEQSRDHRRIMVRAWYPARTVDGYSRSGYVLVQEVKVQSAIMADFLSGLGMPDYFFTHLSQVRTNSYFNAPVADSQAGFPVIIFSHGYLGNVGSNSALMEGLASQGYIALSITHPYESSLVVYPDGGQVRVAQSVLDFMKNRSFSEDIKVIGSSLDIGERYHATKNIFTHNHLVSRTPVWREDMLSVADGLAEPIGNGAVKSLLQEADLNRIGYIGMSFGAPAAASACHIDQRCRAAVNLDGAHYNLDLFGRDIRTPMLVFSKGGKAYPDGFRYNDFSYEALATSGERDDIYRWILRDSGHWDFTDYSLMIHRLLKGVGPSRFVYGPISGERAMAVLSQSVGAFFDRYLKDDSAVDLNRLAQSTPEIIRQDTTRIKNWFLSHGPGGVSENGAGTETE